MGIMMIWESKNRFKKSGVDQSSLAGLAVLDSWGGRGAARAATVLLVMLLLSQLPLTYYCEGKDGASIIV